MINDPNRTRFRTLIIISRFYFDYIYQILSSFWKCRSRLLCDFTNSILRVQITSTLSQLPFRLPNFHWSVVLTRMLIKCNFWILLLILIHTNYYIYRLHFLSSLLATQRKVSLNISSRSWWVDYMCVTSRKKENIYYLYNNL